MLCMQSLEIPVGLKEIDEVEQLCSLCCLVRPRQPSYTALPWASETIGRSSAITSFSMWMKCTLRAEAEAVGGGEMKRRGRGEEGARQNLRLQLSQRAG